MLKKEKRKEETQLNANEQLLNIIAPSGINFSDNYASIGESDGKIYAISRYPSSVDYGWLAELVNLPSTAVSVEYRYSPSDAMISAYDNRISELKSKLEVEKKQSEKDKLEQAIKDLNDMIKRISVKSEPVGYFNIMLHIQDSKDLNNRIKKVTGLIRSQECGVRHLKFKQKQALMQMAPWGIPMQEVANIGERNMPMSTFVGGFPMAAAGLYDSNGHYLGKSKERLIILNMWLRQKDRTNSNWIITGVPGVGKSTFVKALMILEYAINQTFQIVWDAEREYVDMAKHPWINGDVIDCSSGSECRINPLQVRCSPKLDQEDFTTLEKDNQDIYLEYEEWEGTGQSDLALHIQNLRTFFEIYFGKENFTDPEIRRAFEECLIQTYRQKGIIWDTDIRKLKNENFPTMSDFYEVSKEMAKDNSFSERRKDSYERLSSLLYSTGEGADKFLWNGYTTLNPKSDFVVLDTSKLLEMDDRIKNAQFFNLQMWMWHRMSQDRKEKVMSWVDEGYLFVDPELPQLIKFFRNVSKRDRKYEAGLGFITHAVSDLLDPAVKRFGQSIIDTACYKFIMGTDGKNLQETVKLLNLSDKEEALIAAKSRAKGILIAGNVRLEMMVDVTDTMLEMMGKAGGR